MGKKSKRVESTPKRRDVEREFYYRFTRAAWDVVYSHETQEEKLKEHLHRVVVVALTGAAQEFSLPASTDTYRLLAKMLRDWFGITGVMNVLQVDVTELNPYGQELVKGLREYLAS